MTAWKKEDLSVSGSKNRGPVGGIVTWNRGSRNYANAWRVAPLPAGRTPIYPVSDIRIIGPSAGADEVVARDHGGICFSAI